MEERVLTIVYHSTKSRIELIQDERVAEISLYPGPGCASGLLIKAQETGEVPVDFQIVEISSGIMSPIVEGIPDLMMLKKLSVSSNFNQRRSVIWVKNGKLPDFCQAPRQRGRYYSKEDNPNYVAYPDKPIATLRYFQNNIKFGKYSLLLNN